MYGLLYVHEQQQRVNRFIFPGCDDLPKITKANELIGKNETPRRRTSRDKQKENRRKQDYKTELDIITIHTPCKNVETKNMSRTNCSLRTLTTPLNIIYQRSVLTLMRGLTVTASNLDHGFSIERSTLKTPDTPMALNLRIAVTK